MAGGWLNGSMPETPALKDGTNNESAALILRAKWFCPAAHAAYT